MGMDTPGESRLRPHPETRFAPPQVMIDLGAAANRLRAEPHGAGGGHRSQMLILAPGIPHSLTAEVQSDLLVTIRLRQ